MKQKSILEGSRGDLGGSWCPTPKNEGGARVGVWFGIGVSSLQGNYIETYTRRSTSATSRGEIDRRERRRESERKNAHISHFGIWAHFTALRAPTAMLSLYFFYHGQDFSYNKAMSRRVQTGNKQGERNTRN